MIVEANDVAEGVPHDPVLGPVPLHPHSLGFQEIGRRLEVLHVENIRSLVPFGP